MAIAERCSQPFVFQDFPLKSWDTLVREETMQSLPAVGWSFNLRYQESKSPDLWRNGDRPPWVSLVKTKQTRQQRTAINKHEGNLWPSTIGDRTKSVNNKCNQIYLHDFYALRRNTSDALWIYDSWIPPWLEKEISPSWCGLTSLLLTLHENSRTVGANTFSILSEKQLLNKAVQALQNMVNGGIFVSSAIFSHLLESCIMNEDQAAGDEVQNLILRCGLGLDDSLGAHLIRMYSKFRDLSAANKVFAELSNPNVYSWSAIISAHDKLGQSEQAINLYHRMLKSSVKPDDHVFVAVLKACSNISVLAEGKQAHADIVECGSEFNLFVGNTLIDMYGKCGSIQDACILFDMLPQRDIVTWNTLIAAHSENGHTKVALDLFNRMKFDGMKPDYITFVCLLKAYSSVTTLEQGKQMHAHIIAAGFESDVSVVTSLMGMYIKCRSLECVLVLVNRLKNLNIVTWNVLAEFVQHGGIQEAIQLFQVMREVSTKPTSATFIFMLKLCSSELSLEYGLQIQIYIIESGFDKEICVGNSLIGMYGNCGSLIDACRVFNRLPTRDVVTWSALIAGYVENGHTFEALKIFHQMQEVTEPNQVTFVCILKAISCMGALDQGKQIHFCIMMNEFESNISVSNALVDMYSKCGSLHDAFTVFERMPRRDVITWNTLIAGYTQHCYGNQVFQTLQNMQQEGVEPDMVTFVCMLKACSSIGTLNQGKWMHSQIIEHGYESALSVMNTLMDMYAKCGSLNDALTVFERLSKQDVVTWNVLLAGYAQHGHGQEALDIFWQMQQRAMEPNQRTFVSILKACSSVAALEQGRQVHHYIISRGLELNPFVGTALIGMYGQCGSLEEATAVFERAHKGNIATWNALMAEQAQHSNYTAAFQIFKNMQQSGLRPNEVSFVCLLSTCSHVGRVDEGFLHFKSMRYDYSIMPNLEHYTCMVDLLGHSGYLNEAEDLLETLPFVSPGVGWRSLLSSCRTHRVVGLGRRCFNHIVTLEPRNSAAYALMSNIYVYAGLWENAEEIERLRSCGNVWKKPAKAYIEIGKKVQHFVVGDKSHPKSDAIYKKLEALRQEMKGEGYRLHFDSALNLVSEEDKEYVLCGHSERLAVAFGLISTPHGTTLRVAKNLRVCPDCHFATKFISKIEMREIIMTDAYRVHHFKDGGCSCKDYYL